MKRLILLILADVLVLGLLGCTESPALEEVHRASDTPTQEAASVTSPALTDHPLPEHVIGKWILNDENSEHQFSTLTVNRDGTCLVDGEPLTWRYTYRETLTHTGNLNYRLRYNRYELGLYGSYPQIINENDIPWLSDFQLLRANCPLYLIRGELLPVV